MMDAYLLPVQYKSGDCAVDIRMRRSHTNDKASWLDLIVNARGVKDRCYSKGRLGVQRTGGWVHAGKSERIEVRLSRVGSGGGGVLGNGSLLYQGTMEGNSTAYE